MVQDGIWLLILFSQKNLFKLADCSSLVLRLKSTGRILSFIVQHHHNSFVVPVSMKQVVGHVCLEAFLDLYQRSDIKASVWKTIILYKNKCSSTSPSSFHTNLATLFFTFFYYSEKICLCPNSFVLFLLSFSLSLSLMGTGHKHYEKKGSGFFFFFFFFFPATEWFWHKMTAPGECGRVTSVPRLCFWTWEWRWRSWGRVPAWCSWSSQCRSGSAAGKPRRQSSDDTDTRKVMNIMYRNVCLTDNENLWKPFANVSMWLECARVRRIVWEFGKK